MATDDMGRVEGMDTDWMFEGLCRTSGISPDAWFEKLAKGKSKHWHQGALQTCKVCPVKFDCLEYALEREEEYGIWGGLTPKERLAEIERRNTDAV